MPPDEFRRQGHAAVDWIAEYLERIEECPVLSRVTPGERGSARDCRAYSAGLEKISETLCPPNPMELLIACVTSAWPEPIGFSGRLSRGERPHAVGTPTLGW